MLKGGRVNQIIRFHLELFKALPRSQWGKLMTVPKYPGPTYYRKMGVGRSRVALYVVGIDTLPA